MTNPYGANQYQMDPRQKKCWELYIDPNSETFSNGLQSALRAGYDSDTAKHITLTPWFNEKQRRLNLLGRAEEKLKEVLDLPILTIRGETDRGVIDVAKFVAETQGKHVGYSKRSPLLDDEGNAAVLFQISETVAKKNGLTKEDENI